MAAGLEALRALKGFLDAGVEIPPQIPPPAVLHQLQMHEQICGKGACGEGGDA